MANEQLISAEVPTILPDDNGSRALELMEGNGLTNIPVVADDKYMALVKESDMLDWATPDDALSKSQFLRYSPAVLAGGHPFDAVKVAYQHNLTVVPVVDKENNYLGSITRGSMLTYFAEHSGYNNPGGIVVLEMNPRDYSLYEIARICESEEAIIVNTNLYTNPKTQQLELTIKTNKMDIDGLTASLERFGYKVIERYGQHVVNDDMQDRFDLLMNYINM